MSRELPAATLAWHGRPTRGEKSDVLSAVTAIENGGHTLSAGARRVRTLTLVDTVDRRLRSKGLVLTHERASGHGRLVLDGPDGTAVTELVEPLELPATAGRLPEGDVRVGVSQAMSVRAVLPLATGRLVVREVSVLDAEDRMVALLEWLELTGREPVKAGPFVRVHVRPADGRGKDARRVAKALRKADGFARADVSVADELLAAREPEPQPRPEVTADTPADVAVATALLGFSDAVVANVDGVLDDVDTEFLHELRVAVRRTRSLLKHAGDIVPARLVERHASGFKWLGDASTPTRDLDVYLLNLESLTDELTVGTPADLDPFAAQLRREREKAWRALCRTLRTQRFARLVDGWRAGLEDVVNGAGTADVSTADFTAERLRTSAKTVVDRAKAITPDSPADDVHDLRKRCKELRYLLEFGEPVCDRDGHKAVLKDLKRLQDTLGAFQDAEVQSESLRVFARQLQASGSPPADTLLAMGELSARFADRQHEARHALTEVLRRFLASKPGARVKSLVSS